MVMNSTGRDYDMVVRHVQLKAMGYDTYVIL